MIDIKELNLPLNIQAVVERFVDACQADDRILAAFLGGSYASGKADAHSDLDFKVVTSDDGFQGFASKKAVFVKALGQTEFIEDFDNPAYVFVFLSDGTEIELEVIPEGRLSETDDEPYCALVDKQGLLAEVSFRGRELVPAEQEEKLRRLIAWFWHDAGHFLKAMHRGQHWFAQGELEMLRGMCVGLVRMQANFMDGEAATEPYFKLENAVEVERLAALRPTFGALDRASLLKAGKIIFGFYRELALPLAQAHHIDYPEQLEQVMLRRLENLDLYTAR